MAKNKMCFIFHSWGKWEQYAMEKYIPDAKRPYSIVTRQKVTCSACNAMKDRFVSEIY
jgi:hypothetical protein